jgi:DNA-binding MarR family transcriptional regulator
MSIAKNAKTRPAPSAHEVALEKSLESLSTLAGLFRIDVDRATAIAGLSQPAAIVLGRLGKLPDRTTVSELARSVGCNMGNLSVLLDRLEEAGYIERIVGEADRRARFIRLTAPGRRVATQLTENFRSGPVCTALKQMSVRQLEALSETFDRLNSAVKTEAAG